MEDIETIQNIIATYKTFSNVPIEENDIKALENIVERYKELEEENNNFKSKINEGLEDIEKALNHPYWQMARAELLYGKRLLLNLKE